ncbi:MAG TPA: protein kinase, partial [Vicinamibacteria bacterium]|nr:protein kinase [Vicinamibacteria bacterium]
MDIFLPAIVVVSIAWVVLPRVLGKLKGMGVWDRILDNVGGEKLRLMQFEREISRLKRKGDVVGAARLYEEAEWFPEAIQLFVEAEEYASAGSLYERLEQWEAAAETYLKAEDWKRAAQMYAKVGKPVEAAKLYEEHGQKIDAARLYAQGGLNEKAAAFYEDVSFFVQAAKCYEKIGDHVKAAENYEQHWAATSSLGGGGLISSGANQESKAALYAGKLYEKGGAPERAAELYRRAGLTEQAASLAVKEGRFRDAAELLLREEKLQDAAELFEKAGEAERAALLLGEIAFQQGDTAAAAAKFLEGGDNLRAAELYESAGNLEAAARCYEQSGAPLQAANVFLRANKKNEAAAMFERGGDFEQAARLYEDIGNLSKASELYEKSGQFYEAGKLAHEQNHADRAIRLLQQVESDHEHYDSATLILSRLFIDKDLPGLAVEKLKRLLGDQQIGGQNLGHYYWLGVAYETMGKLDEAIDTFRKVMTERYGYGDVEERIARLSSPGPSNMPPSGPTSYAPGLAALLPTADPTPPQTTGRAPAMATGSPLELLDELGRGLLGTTYRAFDKRTESSVVVKILRRELLRDKEVVQRFLTEAKIARSLDHPGVVRLLGLIEVQGSRAVVTDYVEGFDLKRFLKRSKRLSVRQALDLLTTLSLALGYAHERNLMHRDLKPTNILVGKGGKLRLSGLGFGALRLPQLGRADGYPSPEFLNGGLFDARADIYALGAVIFHALTGFNPENEALCTNGAPPQLRELVPDAPPQLELILARCLMKEPSQRFANASELASAAKSISN